MLGYTHRASRQESGLKHPLFLMKRQKKQRSKRSRACYKNCVNGSLFIEQFRSIRDMTVNVCRANPAGGSLPPQVPAL